MGVMSRMAVRVIETVLVVVDLLPLFPRNQYKSQVDGADLDMQCR